MLRFDPPESLCSPGHSPACSALLGESAGVHAIFVTLWLWFCSMTFSACSHAHLSCEFASCHTNSPRVTVKIRLCDSADSLSSLPRRSRWKAGHVWFSGACRYLSVWLTAFIIQSFNSLGSAREQRKTALQSTFCHTPTFSRGCGVNCGVSPHTCSTSPGPLFCFLSCSSAATLTRELQPAVKPCWHLSILLNTTVIPLWWCNDTTDMFCFIIRLPLYASSILRKKKTACVCSWFCHEMTLPNVWYCFLY